jgi:hypothetical protein
VHEVADGARAVSPATRIVVEAPLATEREALFMRAIDESTRENLVLGFHVYSVKDFFTVGNFISSGTRKPVLVAELWDSVGLYVDDLADEFLRLGYLWSLDKGVGLLNISFMTNLHTPDFERTPAFYVMRDVVTRGAVVGESKEGVKSGMDCFHGRLEWRGEGELGWAAHGRVRAMMLSPAHGRRLPRPGRGGRRALARADARLGGGDAEAALEECLDALASARARRARRRGEGGNFCAALERLAGGAALAAGARRRRRSSAPPCAPSARPLARYALALVYAGRGESRCPQRRGAGALLDRNSAARPGEGEALRPGPARLAAAMLEPLVAGVIARRASSRRRGRPAARLLPGPEALVAHAAGRLAGPLLARRPRRAGRRSGSHGRGVEDADAHFSRVR